MDKSLSLSVMAERHDENCNFAKRTFLTSSTIYQKSTPQVTTHSLHTYLWIQVQNVTDSKKEGWGCEEGVISQGCGMALY